jgi:predicted nuclease with TOPRIM domain
MAIELPDTRAIGLSAANLREYVAEIAKAHSLNLEALESFTHLTTGVGKLANGMAQLTLAGREDSKEIGTLLTQFSGLESAIEGAGLIALGGAQRLQQMSVASAAATTATGRLMAAAGNLGPALAALAVGYAIGSTIHRMLHRFHVQEKIGRDFNDTDMIKSGVQGQIDALSRMLDLQRSQRNAVRDTVQERMREVDAQNQLIRQAKEALKQERGRLQSMEAAFSRLNPVERDELAQIARKKSRGEQLNDVELARLERSNIAPLQNFAEEQRAAQGRAFGSNFVISPFAGRPLRGTGSEEQRLETEITGRTTFNEALAESVRELKQEDSRLLENLIRQVHAARRETIRLSTLLADTNAARNSAF